MSKKIRYICSECGYVSTGWVGKCPSCDSWGSMEESAIEKNDNTSSVLKRKKTKEELLAIPIKEVKLDRSERWDTGIEELNRVLGGGLIKDSVTMLTARPGAGKSTLLLQVAESLSYRGVSTLYASGEESSSQIKARACRIFSKMPEKLFLISGNSMERVMDEVSRLKPDILILDSVQTFELEEYPQRRGTPTQTLQVTSELVEMCKDRQRSMASFIVGHMTKNNEMAGIRTLEHLVDTVLYLDDAYDGNLRLLRASKNRFGYTGEVGLFKMEEDGLIQVSDPYELFLTRRSKSVIGTAISLQKEGSRFIPIEIEALVSPSYEAYPTRIGDSIGRDRLNTYVAILEEKAGIKLGSHNVIIKAVGGMKIKERSSDLATLVAIASSYGKFNLDSRDAFIAEVGLTGELRRVEGLDRRLSELARLGFRRVFVSAYADLGEYGKLEVFPCKNIKELFSKIK